MSYDFAFWNSEELLESDEAGEIYSALVQNRVSERVKPSTKIALLAQEIKSRWPVPGRGQEDDWPLAAPLDVSEAHLIVASFRPASGTSGRHLASSRSSTSWSCTTPSSSTCSCPDGCPGNERVPGPRRNARPACEGRCRLRMRYAERVAAVGRRPITVLRGGCPRGRPATELWCSAAPSRALIDLRNGS
jgi:hypothetical protein